MCPFSFHVVLCLTSLFVICQVAQFLRVNPETGLFFFDSSYRPVPLAQQYIGISEKDYLKRMNLFNLKCYEKVAIMFLIDSISYLCSLEVRYHWNGCFPCISGCWFIETRTSGHGFCSFAQGHRENCKDSGNPFILVESIMQSHHTHNFSPLW